MPDISSSRQQVPTNSRYKIFPVHPKTDLCLPNVIIFFRHHLASICLINNEIFLKCSKRVLRFVKHVFYVLSSSYFHELNCIFVKWFSNIVNIK